MLLKALLAAAVLSVVAVSSVTGMRVAPEFLLDLGLPPSARWTGVVSTILELHPWEHSFEPLMAYYNATYYNLIPSANRTALENVVKTRFPEEYAELQSISADFAASGYTVSVHWLSQWFWFHEVAHAAELNMAPRACTAILALPPDPTLPVVHGRNLDQMPLPSRNITLTITFINSSAPLNPTTNAPTILFQAVDMYWMSGGFVTGFKSGSLTMQENWRFGAHAAPQMLASIVQQIVTNPATIPQVHMFRFIMENRRGMGPHTDFDSAVHFLNTSVFAAPYYAAISGTGRRGAVLSIALDAADNRVQYLGSSGFPDHPWFAVQTNWDQWRPDQGRMRRTHAEANLVELGALEGSTHLGVWQSISAYPVHNEGTFYTVVMDVSMVKIRGIIRQPMMPWNASCSSQAPLLGWTGGSWSP